MKCPKCSAELSEDTKFCSYCGENVTVIDSVKTETDTNKNKKTENTITAFNYPISEASTQSKTSDTESFSDKLKAKLITMWNRMDLFCKAETIALTITGLLMIIALCVGKILPILFSFLQSGGLIVALLIHKEKIKIEKKWLKYFILVIAIFISIVNIASYFWWNNSSVTSPYSNIVTTVSTPYSAADCIGKNRSAIKNDFQLSGFTNISEEVIDDLELLDVDKEGIVVTISVNGISDFKGNADFKSSSKVIITYHSFKCIDVPLSSDESKNMETDALIKTFKEAGFINISTEEENDLDPDTTQVKFENHISINETTSFNTDAKFPLNADIKIVTHKPYEKYTLKVTIDFVPNIMFSNYDVKLNVAGKTETLSHGKDAEFEYRLKPDKYTLAFSSADDSSVNGTVELELLGDTEASYKINCYSDEVSIETLYVETKSAIGEKEAMVPSSATDCVYQNYKDIETSFQNAGFTNITTKILYDIVLGWTAEGEVEQVSIDGKTDFIRGTVFAKDAVVVITYHMNEEDDPNKTVESETAMSETSVLEGTGLETTEPENEAVFYSTNNYETATKGNTGVFSYKSKGGSYDTYWIIDFDAGYVYYFTEGNGESTCDRLKIESGDLNSYLKITYHDGNDLWSCGLHFKYINHPEHLIMQDDDGFEYDYYTTSLSSALSLKNSKTIKDY